MSNFEGVKPADQAGIKVTLSNTSIINKWEEPLYSNLPDLINSIRNIKQSVNNYLTDLVNKEKGSVDKGKKDTENSDDEEEDVEDNISGFIKKAVANVQMNEKNKRKVHGGAKSQKAKKKKK